jgi:hypothetical protein
MHHPMRQDPDIGLFEFGDPLSALHALREHREDLPREALDLWVVWPGSNVHSTTIKTRSARRYLFSS